MSEDVNQNQTTELTEDVPVPRIPKGGLGDDVTTMIESVLDARDNRQRELLKSTLARLTEPRSDRFEHVLPKNDPKQTEPVRIAPSQPTDVLYRKLYRSNEAYRDCRSPEQDYWNHQWLLALIDRDVSRVRLAYEKSNAAYRRNIRATTLEGALDASDPTAILGGTGGSLLPQGFSQVVMIAREASAVIGGLATVYPMNSATLRIPTAGAATAAKRAEGNAVAQGEPAYASKMLRAEALTVFMKASREFIADSAFAAVSLFGERAGMAIGAKEDVDFCTTDGVHPNASEALAGANVDEATSTVLTYPDVSKLYRAIPKAYRGAGCAWLAGNTVLGLLDVLVDADGRPILVNPGATVQPIGDSPGNEGMIFRHPVYEVPLPTGVLLFGNIRAGYGIGRREGISVRVSEHAEFSAGLVQFMIEERYDAVVQDAGALRQMAGLASVA